MIGGTTMRRTAVLLAGLAVLRRVRFRRIGGGSTPHRPRRPRCRAGS